MQNNAIYTLINHLYAKKATRNGANKQVAFSCPAPFSELLGDGILETLEVNIRSKRECWRHVRVCTGMYGSGAGFVR